MRNPISNFTAKDFFEKLTKSNVTGKRSSSTNENSCHESTYYAGLKLPLSYEAQNKSHTMKSFSFNRNVYDHTEGLQNSNTETFACSLSQELNPLGTLDYYVMEDHKHLNIKLESPAKQDIFELEALSDLHGETIDDFAAMTAGGQDSDMDSSSDIIDPLDFLNDDLYRSDLSNGGVDLSEFVQHLQHDDLQDFDCDLDHQISSYSAECKTDPSLNLHNIASNNNAESEIANPVVATMVTQETNQDSHGPELLVRPGASNNTSFLFALLPDSSKCQPKDNFSNVGSLMADPIIQPLILTTAVEPHEVKNSIESNDTIMDIKPDIDKMNLSINAISSTSLNSEVDIKPIPLYHLNNAVLSLEDDTKPKTEPPILETENANDQWAQNDTDSSKGMSESSDYDHIAKLPLAPEEALNELKIKLKLPLDAKLEFINGGYGVKNPLSSENIQRTLLRDLHEIIQQKETGRYACTKCSATFANLRLCKRHILRHSEVKRYLCTICGKGFNDSFDLKRHTRTHTGVRPYKCESCPRGFSQQSSLEFHCMKVHNIQKQYAYNEKRQKTYVCEECGHSCGDPKEHYHHIKDNHSLTQSPPNIFDKRQFKLSTDDYFALLSPLQPKKHRKHL